MCVRVFVYVYNLLSQSSVVHKLQTLRQTDGGAPGFTPVKATTGVAVSAVLHRLC